jgi:hypothetical protein
MTNHLDYGAVFDATRHPYLVLSPDFTIMDANRAYLCATMSQRDAIRGRHIFEVFPDNPADAKADGTRNLGASLRRVLALRRPDAMPVQRYDIRGTAGDFQERYWDPTNTPVIADGDRVVAIVHHVSDVTQRVMWRAPHVTRRLIQSPISRDDLPKTFAAAELIDTDKMIKETQNRIAETEVALSVTRDVIENARATIAASRDLIEKLRSESLH